MPKLDSAVIGSLLGQIYLVAKHQEWAENNQPNQLCDMIEALNLLTETIGNANHVGITSIDPESIEILMERHRLEAKLKNTQSTEE